MMLSCKVSLAMHIDAFPYYSDWKKNSGFPKTPQQSGSLRWKGEDEDEGASAQKASEKRSFPPQSTLKEELLSRTRLVC